MTRVFHEMSNDASVPRRRLWRAMLGDVVHGLSGGFSLGLLIGCGVLAVWYVGRSHHPVHIGTAPGLSVIFALLLSAGFIGARRSGSVLGGMWAGLVAGCVSALTVPGDYLLVGLWIDDPWALAFSLAITAAVVMAIVALGALLAGVGRHQRRVRRSVRAFASAWVEPT